MSVDRSKKSQVLVSSVILLKTALDALPLLSMVPLSPPSLSLSHTHTHMRAHAHTHTHTNSSLELGIPEVIK